LSVTPSGVTSAPFVEFAGVAVTYGAGTPQAVAALSPTDLAFGRGEFICIVGPSGCGKTTLMQTLAGFLPPTTGMVSVGGQAVRGPGPERGVVFQQAALFPWKTVAANAGFGPAMRGLPRAVQRERVEYWLHSVGLWEFRDRYPYELSGGMQQRLAIARALANEPEILLMDEPFGALDTHTKIDMHDVLLKIWEREQQTVLFVTHDLGEALTLADRIILFSARPGRIKETFEVDFPRPRDPVRLRETPRYAELFTHIWHSLGEEFIKGRTP
jgi:NitT/TauT family transport system ATP-binding protein